MLLNYFVVTLLRNGDYRKDMAGHGSPCGLCILCNKYASKRMSFTPTPKDRCSVASFVMERTEITWSSTPDIVEVPRQTTANSLYQSDDRVRFNYS